MTTLDMFPDDSEYLSEQQVLAEGAEYFTYVDVSTYISDKGLDYVLSTVVRLIDNPQEQHLLNRLIQVLRENESDLLSTRPLWWQN